MRKLLVVTINDLYIFLSKSSIVLAAEDELSRMIYALSIQGGDSLIRQSLAFYTVCCLSPNNKLLLCVCVCVFYFSFFWGGGEGGLWGVCGDSQEFLHDSVSFFKIALERNFTRGRRVDQVAAACLYIACR